MIQRMHDSDFTTLYSLFTVCLYTAPPAGATAPVCGAAGDQSSAGGTADRCTGTLLLAKGAREGQSSAASENHRRGSGGCSLLFEFPEVCLNMSVIDHICV